MLWSFLFIISFGVCFGQHARYFQFKIEKNGNSGLIWRFEGIDNINKKPNSVDKSWSLTYITSDTFFVEVESLDKRIQSWQCGDRKLSTSDDCNGLNLYNVTHSCKEEDYLYSGILLEFGKTEAWTTIYTICCRKTDVTSGYKYIAVKKMLNHSEAQDYCSKNFTKFSANGTLCSFQSQSDWKNISDLIKTLECTGSNTLYWTGLKFNNKTDSYNFSDGTNATFATGLVINRDSKEKCVVANSSHLERSPCSKKAYFICKITMNNVSTPAVTSSSQPSTQPSTTVQEPPRTSDSSANVATSSISSSTATSSTLAKTITLGTPETTVSEPIATITSTILQATTLITEETTMTTLKPITTAVLESTATIATATTTTVLESTATTPMTEGTTTATGATTTRTEGTKPLTSSPNIASSSDMTGLPTTFRTSIVNPTTTVSSVEPSSTTADNEFEKELNNVNVKKEGAMQKIIKITTDFINNEASKDTTDPAVLIAPLVENKLIEYGKANLDTRHNGLYRTKTKELEILMRTVAHVKSSQQDITFPVPTKQNAETEDFIKVPLDPSLSNDSILVVILYNVSPGSDSKESTQQKLISNLISVEIAPKPTEYSSNITFSLEHENYSHDKVYCAFINESKTKAVSDSPFSTQGCRKVKFSGTRTECTCNHMTSFAVIAKIDGKKIPVDAKHRQALSIITYIGLTLSLIGETLTVASYVLLIGMNTEQAHLHTNLAFSLGLAQIFFLAGINCATSEIACLLVTAMIHYFYLVTFCWMLVEGFHLYLMVVKVFNENSYLKLYYLFSWVTPLVIVSLALIAAAASPTGVHGYVSNEDICWISHENNYIWFFLGPVLLICLANLVLLILVVREMTRMNTTKGGGSLQFRKSVKACVLLFPILGTTWVFSVLLMLKYSLAVEYIFNILNSLQGFIIFLFYVMRSSEIRGVLQQRKARWANSLDLTNHVSTYQITRTTSDKSQPTSASSIKPILGSWFSPNPCAPSPITTRSSRSTPSPRGTPSPRDTPSPRGTPIPRATPNPRVSPSRFNTPSPFTSSDPPDLFENPRRPSRSITIDPEMETHYAETSA